MFYHEPRNWKWMVPAALIAPCLVWWNDWFTAGGEWADWAMVPLVIAAVLFVAAGVNMYLYVMEHQADIYANVQTARNATPEVRMMEAAKGMHPEAVKALLVHRRTIWRIRYIPQKELVDWILDEAASVHAGFVDFVLDHSNGVSLMPKRILREGSTQFDPDGVVTDYQQYDDLLFLMQQKLMVTQAYGNQSPHFLPPWNVDLLRKRFGLDGEGYEVDEEMSEAMKRLVGGQRLAVSDERSAISSQQSAPNDVIAKALEGLEQSDAMKVNAARVYKLNS